jgi:hypothetical protein
MSDLDKIMQNLRAKKEDVKKVEPKEEEIIEEVAEEEAVEEEIDEEEDEEDEEAEPVEEAKPVVVAKPKVAVKPIAKLIAKPIVKEKVIESPQAEADVETLKSIGIESVEAEVAILQNDGVFRREILLIEKDRVDLLKVIAQTLLDIKDILKP